MKPPGIILLLLLLGSARQLHAAATGSILHIGSPMRYGAGHRLLPWADSLLPVLANRMPSGTEMALEAELTSIETGYTLSGNHQQAFTNLLQFFKSGSARWARTLRSRLYSDMARVSARLRLYPLAIKCYYNAGRFDNDLPSDSAFYRATPMQASQPANIDSIADSFEDDKAVLYYALVIEVKQPIPGKRKAFTHINNVGHTFITLIKYNTDNTVAVRSFGFYPHKAGPLSATPFHPSSPSVIKDDSRHDWDESVARIITAQQFSQLLKAAKTFNHKKYNLNHNNCTDFGLTLASIGKIDIQNTAGQWPLGKGNTPGSAGQSILEGRYANLDPTDRYPLFEADNNIPGHL